MRYSLAALGSILLIVAALSSADVLLYDSFDNYPDGQVDGVGGQADIGSYDGDWSGSTAGGSAEFEDGKLKIWRPSGSWSEGFYRAQINPDASPGGTAYYFSGLLTVDDGVNTVRFGLNNDQDGDDRRQEIGFTESGNAAIWSNASIGDIDSPAAETASTYAFGDTYLLVAKVEDKLHWDGDDDRVTLWIDPVLGTSEEDNAAALQALVGWDGFYPDQPGLTDFAFQAGTNDEGETVTLDDLRVGDSWADVVIPEPTTIALLGIGAFAALRPRRR
ncbi:MAG: PEP-CTERM sorting domain-containing protein [bacterium]